MDIEKYAHVATADELKENDYNLNVRRYIDSSEEEDQIDVVKVWAELRDLEKERDTADKRVENFLKELGYW